MRPSQASNTRPESPLPGAAVASSLWLRIGFFAGASLVAIGLRALAIGDASLLQAIATIMIGGVLAALSTRRSWTLLQEAEASPQALRPAAAVRSYP